MRDNTQHYRELFLDDIPLMDVRAPVEYHKGAFPNTVNRPLMNDIERQKVGTSYKQHGQQAAIALGHELVCGAPRPNGWRPGKPSPKPTRTATCIASAAACARRSSSSG